METDASYELEVINPPTKAENDSMVSGNPEDHGVLEESDENDQVEENEDEDTTGVYLYFSVIVKH